MSASLTIRLQPDEETERKLDLIVLLLNDLKRSIATMANELQDLEQQVSETNTVIGSAITLIQGLAAALAAAGTDPVKLKALRDSLDASEQALAAAVAANTSGGGGGTGPIIA